MTRIAYGYVRLSREDAGTDDTLQARARMCREIADRNRLDLPLDRIITERESGGSIANRPGLLRLLALCRRGEVSHVVTPEQSRLLRGDKRDEAEIEDVFRHAGITLVSSEGVLDFADDEADMLTYEFRALAARNELRTYVRRRKRAMKQALKDGRRPHGSPPYGYVRDKQHPCGYQVDEERYAVALEILERALRGESLKAIAQSLTERRIPTAEGGQGWRASYLRTLVTNPFYGGRYGQRFDSVRGKPVPRRPDKFEFAEVPGTWPHPISWQDYLDILSQFLERRPRRPKSLLTGLLHCSAGSLLYGNSGAGIYFCNCQMVGRASHPGMSVNMSRADDFVRDFAGHVICSLPSKILRQAQKPEDMRLLRQRLHEARRTLREAERTTHDMMTRAAYYTSLFGITQYEESARRAGATFEEAKRKEAAISELASQPQLGAVLPLVDRIRRTGFLAIWEALNTPDRQALLAAVIKAVHVTPPPRLWQHVRDLRIECHDWAAPSAPPVPAFRTIKQP